MKKRVEEKKKKNPERTRKKKEKRLHSYPAPDPDPPAASHGRRRRAVDAKLHVAAPARLELLRGDGDGAARAAVEDRGAVDGPDEELAVAAVGGLDLGGVVEDVDGAVCEVSEGERLAVWGGGGGNGGRGRLAVREGKRESVVVEAREERRRRRRRREEKSNGLFFSASLRPTWALRSPLSPAPSLCSGESSALPPFQVEK